MKRVLGYTDPWSAAPGDTVDIHVSLLAGNSYDLDVVRVVSGDAQGLGLDLRPVPSPIDGSHAGSLQPLRSGSAMMVDPAPPLAPEDELRMEAWLWPTTPAAGRQALLGGWSTGGGFGVEIGDDGCIAFVVDGPDGTVRLRHPRPLAAREWLHVAAGFMPASGELCIVLTLAGGAAEVVRCGSALRRVPAPDVLILAAATATGRGLGAHFNGKLAGPQLWSGGRCVAAWSFAPADAGPVVADPVGGHRGRLINLPARAVTGPNWSGDVHDWRAAPDEYAAIHFHEDDLYDARWPVSHRLIVPDAWPSGYYAVRLRTGGDTTYLPIFVRPPRGTATAPLAVLASTLTTIAYGNYHFHLEVDSNEAALGRVGILLPEDVLLAETALLGRSTYDLHADGSPVRFASRRRPIVNNWPGGEVWNLNADTHLLAWLDQIGQPYDLITDEDLHAEGAPLLARYRAVIAGSHPEYWTTPMWDGLTAYLSRGGKLLYLGGNGFYWRTAVSPDWPGAVEVRRAEGGGRYTAEVPGHHHMAFTGELGGLWRRSGRPPNGLVGVGTRGIGFDGIGHFRRTAASYDMRAAWLFAGVDTVTFGDSGLVGCAAGSEIDAADATLGTPLHALIVATSEGHTAAMQPMPEEILMPHPAMAASHDPRVRAEMTFFETPGGGAVFSAASLSWAGAVAADGFDNAVARITGNVLARFLDALPFVVPDA